MLDVKCKNCNRLLAKATMMTAAIKCPRCKMIFEYKVFSNYAINNLYDPAEIKSLTAKTQNEIN